MPSPIPSRRRPELTALEDRRTPAVELFQQTVVAGGPGEIVVLDEQVLTTGSEILETVTETRLTFDGLGVAPRPVLADVTGDGFPEVVVGSGPGVFPRVLVTDLDGNVLSDFLVPGIPGGYTGGLFVAAGDITVDEFAEVVVVPDLPGAGPIVSVFDGGSLVGGDPALLSSFNGLAGLNGVPDTNFRGGGRVAVGDGDGDGLGDVIVAAGNTGGPRVTTWPGTGFAAAGGGLPTDNPFANLFVFEETQRDGAFVTAGDFDGDDLDDIALGGGPNGGPRVRVVDSAELLQFSGAELEGLDLDQNTDIVLNNFFAGDPNARGGVRVAAKDFDQDGIADLVTGSGAGLASDVLVYTEEELIEVAEFDGVVPQGVSVDPFDDVVYEEGLFVG